MKKLAFNIAIDGPAGAGKSTIAKICLLYTSDLNVCSQKGLVERFDGSIGAGSVFMPYGGKYQLTETQTLSLIHI